MSRRKRTRAFIVIVSTVWATALLASVIVVLGPDIDHEVQWLIVAGIQSAAILVTVLITVWFITGYISTEISERDRIYQMGLNHGVEVAESLHVHV